MENTTRIADLPENIQTPQNHVQFAGGGGGGGGGGGSEMGGGFGGNNYVPINIHPNPYGPQPPELQQQPQPQQNPPQQQRLPSRDIHYEQTDYLQDNETQVNYIPKPKAKNLKDYLNEYENEMTEEEDKIKKHRKNKKNVRFADDIFVKLQIPLMIVVLFFLFQLPLLNTLLKNKYLSILSLFKEDGNVSLYGMIFKSGLFGVCFYIGQEAGNYF
jgi:hypothetical protein